MAPSSLLNIPCYVLKVAFPPADATNQGHNSQPFDILSPPLSYLVYYGYSFKLWPCNQVVPLWIQYSMYAFPFYNCSIKQLHTAFTLVADLSVPVC